MPISQNGIAGIREKGSNVDVCSLTLFLGRRMLKTMIVANCGPGTALNAWGLAEGEVETHRDTKHQSDLRSDGHGRQRPLTGCLVDIIEDVVDARHGGSGGD